MTSTTSSEIIEKIGDQVLIDELGFSERNLRHIRRQGRFPGGWYVPVKNLCEIHGVKCPLSAFIWKGADKKNGNSNAKFQVEGRQSTPHPSGEGV